MENETLFESFDVKVNKIKTDRAERIASGLAGLNVADALPILDIAKKSVIARSTVCSQESAPMSDEDKKDC